jgi:hypothetical protein
MPLTPAIIGHLVGDYLLQPDWMAQNKKKSSFACAAHCTVWTLSVCAFAGWWSPAAVAVLWSTHFVQDRTNLIMWWMTKVARQQQFATGACSPWSIIVVDNIWHILAIWAVWRFVI